jgi:5-formyltetrahydrofolate cyclo-ligase
MIRPERNPGVDTIRADDLRSQKAEIRRQALAQLQAQPHQDEVSRQILATLVSLPEYQQARTVMLYISVRSEVRTRPFLPGALIGDKKIVVPFCRGGQLELFHLEALDELEKGVFQLLEPREGLRALPEKSVAAEELDLVVVPGVAFDRHGGRTGHGMGYYDRLLHRVRPDTSLVALAFECQLFDAVPMHARDVFMDKIITEQAVYQGRGRS